LKGIILQPDACAEHEWGVKGLKNDFGVPGTDVEKDCIGLKARQITIVPKTLYFKKTKTYCTLMFYRDYSYDPRNPEEIIKNLDRCEHIKYGFTSKIYPRDKVAAWDEREFLVIVKGKENIKKLEMIYKAFQDKNIAIFFKYMPFMMGGLTFGVASRIQEYDEAWKKSDISQYKLHKASDATGIEEYLKEHGKRYYALSPRWSNDEETEIHWYLNPMEQKLYNYGNFTLKELKEWAHDEGPVIKGNERKKKAKINIVSATET
jgi:hypothetical protein